MSITGLEALKIWQYGFINQKASELAEILTDDFIFVNSELSTRTKEQTLDWVSNSEIRLGDFEILYENNEVIIGLHSVAIPEQELSQAMFFARIKHGKLYYWRTHRKG